MTDPAMTRVRMPMLRMCRSLNAASFYPDLGRQAPVELIQPVGAEAVDLRQGSGRRVEERLHINALAARRERGELPMAASQHVVLSVVIAFAQMVERDTNLQDALIEVADVPPLGAPQEFERLVLLEELAAIELGDALEKQRGRRLVAGHALSLA